MAEAENNPVLDKLDAITALLREIAAKERPPRLLRLKPAAAYLSISVGALRGLIQKGEIEVIKVSENGEHAPWLVDVRSLDEFIQRAKT
jgi:hypothetical protein